MTAFAPNPSASSASSVAGGLGFTFGPQARQTVRPNRVSHRTDGSFAFCCSPPRLAATQLQSATGRSRYTWGRLAPPWSVALAGARSRPPPGWSRFKFKDLAGRCGNLSPGGAILPRQLAASETGRGAASQTLVILPAPSTVRCDQNRSRHRYFRTNNRFPDTLLRREDVRDAMQRTPRTLQTTVPRGTCGR
jgi:hypothetical protein